MSLNVPVRVQGYDSDGNAWEEMTQSGDTSLGGASFVLKHHVFPGQAVFLSIPLPKRFRQYDLTEPSYRAYALVRAVNQSKAGARVGVRFLGKQPPRGFEKNPGGRYLLPSDPPPAPRDRRHYTRLDVFVNLKVRRVDESGRTLQEEQTVTENLSKGGARVMTTLPVSKGEVVAVEAMGATFRTRAEIRNLYIGKDGIPRLNLRFLDGPAPDALISAGGSSGGSGGLGPRSASPA